MSFIKKWNDWKIFENLDLFNNEKLMFIKTKIIDLVIDKYEKKYEDKLFYSKIGDFYLDTEDNNHLYETEKEYYFRMILDTKLFIRNKFIHNKDVIIDEIYLDFKCMKNNIILSFSFFLGNNEHNINDINLDINEQKILFEKAFSMLIIGYIQNIDSFKNYPYLEIDHSIDIEFIEYCFKHYKIDDKFLNLIIDNIKKDPNSYQYFKNIDKVKKEFHSLDKSEEYGLFEFKNIKSFDRLLESKEIETIIYKYTSVSFINDDLLDLAYKCFTEETHEWEQSLERKPNLEIKFDYYEKIDENQVRIDFDLSADVEITPLVYDEDDNEDEEISTSREISDVTTYIHTEKKLEVFYVIRTGNNENYFEDDIKKLEKYFNSLILEAWIAWDNDKKELYLNILSSLYEIIYYHKLCSNLLNIPLELIAISPKLYPYFNKLDFIKKAFPTLNKSDEYGLF